MIFEHDLPGIYHFENGPPLVRVVNDGIRLIRESSAPGRILTLGYVNPFPVALRRPSPRGSSPWFSIGNNTGAGNRLSASELFAEADIVMVPVYRNEESATTESLVNAYRPILENSYTLKARSPYWLLYLKRAPGQ